MAVNETRSMNNDLHSGINDGRLKSITPGRGGQVDTQYPTVRSKMLQTQYNITDYLSGIYPNMVDNSYETGYAED